MENELISAFNNAVALRVKSGRHDLCSSDWNWLMSFTAAMRKTSTVKDWSVQVKADNAAKNNNRWVCTKCSCNVGNKYNVIAHHIYELPRVIRDFIENSKWTDSIDFLDKLSKYKPLTDTRNGRVMCRTCHDKHHGRKPVRRRKTKVVNKKFVRLGTSQ